MDGREEAFFLNLPSPRDEQSHSPQFMQRIEQSIVIQMDKKLHAAQRL
jgi:hypothetical protein